MPLSISLADANEQWWGNGFITLADPDQLENVVGTPGDDHIYLNGADNIAFGLDGNDVIVGYAGRDFLFGGGGDDQILGGDDRDILVAGAGADFVSGDAEDDLLIEGDLEFPDAPAGTFADAVTILDSVMAAWDANLGVADRVANLTGALGAGDPLPEELRLLPGVTLLGDEEFDILAAGIGADLVVLDSRVDSALRSDNSQAVFLEVDPTIETQWATFADGVLTLSYRGSGDLVYSVVDGVLLVNGADLFEDPLPVEDVLNVVTQLGPLAGALDDEILLSGAVANIRSAAYTRASRSEMPFMSPEDVDATLSPQLGSDWEALLEVTAEDVADIFNAGEYGILWELVCEGTRLSSGASMQEASWHEVSDLMLGTAVGIMAESQSSSSSLSSGQEGGTLSIQNPIGDVYEGNAAVFRLTMDAEWHDGFTVHYQTSDLTATGAAAFCAGDYPVTQGNLQWLDAEEGDGQIAIPTYTDYRVESTEQFKVTLSNLVNNEGPHGDVVLGDAVGVASIRDTSTLPKASIGNGYAVEGNLIRLPVTLDHPYQESVTVTWSTADITTEGSQDYSPASGTLTFAPLTCSYGGDTLQYIEILAIDDTVAEYAEKLSVTIAAGSNVIVLAAHNTGEGTIADNDPDPILNAADISVTEGGNAVFTLTLSMASEKEITVTYATSNGTAVAPADYTALPSTQLVFPAGTTSHTVTVATIDDTIPEPVQTFTLQVTNGANVRFPNNAPGIAPRADIADNDPLQAMVRSVSFSGTGGALPNGGIITIQQDPLPVSGNPPPVNSINGDWQTAAGTVYSGPHYLDQNHNGQQDPGDREYPIAYVRNSTPTVQVAIWVEQNEFVQPFRIKGVGGWNINLNPAIAGVVDAGEGNGSKVLTATITSSAALLGSVNYTPGLQINWDVKADDDPAGWQNAGSSQNQAYLTYAYPLHWQQVPIYHTVIHLGSLFAAGETTRDGTVDKAWLAFGTNPGTVQAGPANTTDVNGNKLHYWKNYTDAQAFLPGLLAYKDGSCGAWAYLWGATLMAQGISSTLIEVTATAPYTHMVVKNWNTGGAAGPYELWATNLPGFNQWTFINATGNGYLFDSTSTLVDAMGIPGQNTPNPASIFPNHALVQYVRQDNSTIYYDPSYGKTWADAAAMDASMFGYCEFGLGGAFGTWPHYTVTANPGGNQLIFTPAGWMLWP